MKRTSSFNLFFSSIFLFGITSFLFTSEYEKAYDARTMKYISQGHSRIAVIGTGFVGSTVAYSLMLKNVAAELILVDITKRVEGEVLDLADVLHSCNTSVVRQGTLKDAAQADIIVVTAGVGRKPGQSRLDLIKINKSIIESIVGGLQQLNPHAIVLVVSNPVDIMTFIARKVLDLPDGQVFGSGTFLDTQRLRDEIAKKVGLSHESIHAYMLGEHGDTQFAAWSCAEIAGIPMREFPGITKDFLEASAMRTLDKGREIISLKGATYYGIGSCVAEICESIIYDQKRVLPVSSFHKNVGVCLSLPTVVGERGVEVVLPVKLDDSEGKKLNISVEKLYSVIKNFD